jgi:hypothetical protein
MAAKMRSDAKLHVTRLDYHEIRTHDALQVVVSSELRPVADASRSNLLLL